MERPSRIEDLERNRDIAEGKPAVLILKVGLNGENKSVHPTFDFSVLYQLRSTVGVRVGPVDRNPTLVSGPFENDSDIVDRIPTSEIEDMSGDRSHGPASFRIRPWVIRAASSAASKNSSW